MHIIGSLKASNYKYVDDAKFEVISKEFSVDTSNKQATWVTRSFCECHKIT
jgi:hypothetical protein